MTMNATKKPSLLATLAPLAGAGIGALAGGKANIALGLGMGTNLLAGEDARIQADQQDQEKQLQDILSLHESPDAMDAAITASPLPDPVKAQLKQISRATREKAAASATDARQRAIDAAWEVNKDTGEAWNKVTGEKRNVMSPKPTATPKASGFTLGNQRYEPDPRNPGKYVVVATGPEPAAKAAATDSGNSTLDSLTELVRNDPMALDKLSAEQRGAVLARLGPGFKIPKPLSDAALARINDYDQAISQLANLSGKLETSGASRGPIMGTFQGMNPWATQTQELQAEINRVKQLVGKALEGGVLRKEDEEKYKKILATLSDTPEVAQYKIQSLMQGMQEGLASYKRLVSSGKINPDGSILQEAGAPSGTIGSMSDAELAKRALAGDENAAAELRRRGK